MPGKRLPVSFGSIKVKPPLVQPGQRIGVMGGTFNPPHDGHALISRAALRRLNLDQLWWLVTPGNPLKKNNGLPPSADRIAMCRELAADTRMRVTAFEEDLDTPYTAATLAFLTRRYPGVQFYWIMGADNLASFHRWQQWRDIASRVPIAVVDRPGWHLKAMASPAAQWMRRSFKPETFAAALSGKRLPTWTFLTGPLSKSSSTDIRNARVPDRVEHAAAAFAPQPRARAAAGR